MQLPQYETPDLHRSEISCALRQSNRYCEFIIDSWTIIERTPVPGSDTKLTLWQRDDDFAIRLSGVPGDLMNSRRHHSEEALAELACARLGAVDDARTRLYSGDVTDLIKHPAEKYDAILLDVDNGPQAMTAADNQWLYSSAGLRQIHAALLPGGSVAIWSARADRRFARRLGQAGFGVRQHTVRARPGKGSRHTIFVALKPRE